MQVKLKRIQCLRNEDEFAAVQSLYHNATCDLVPSSYTLKPNSFTYEF
jgi:hypothetical protein